MPRFVPIRSQRRSIRSLLVLSARLVHSPVHCEIKGAWKKGYALDLHTLSSDFIGYNESGHPLFETQRSEVGELLYKLKYQGDKTAVDLIAAAAATLLTKWKPGPELIVPVPPSTKREVQPVLLTGQALAKLEKIPCIDCLKTTREPTKQLKNVTDLEVNCPEFLGGWLV